MANVLILSLVFRPDNVSTAQIMGDLALDLNARGHTVFVITTVPHYNEDAEALLHQPLHTYLGKLLQRSNYRGMEVLHGWMPRKGKNKLLRIVAWLGFHAISTLGGVLTQFKPDVILAPSPPLTIGVCAWLLGLRHNCPFIYNVQEIYPDVAVNLGMIRNSFVIKRLQTLEHFVYAKAAALAVISEGMANHIRAKGIPEEKIRVIPNFVDIEDFRPLPKDNKFSRQYGLHNKFVVSYAGNMGKPQELDKLIEAAHLLRHEFGIHFLMMGDGSERVSLIEQAQHLQLPNITFLPYQPYSSMAEAYAAADASFVSQAPGTSNDGIPSKVYRIMACARPVIACTDANSDLARLVIKADGGVVVDSGDAKSLSDAIWKAFVQRDVWLEKGLKARNSILRDYSRPTVSTLYHELITELQQRDTLASSCERSCELRH
ncbi:MAG: glycosyltransferase family 4 protein [Deltaproteobacteria bacterium]|nr:glycosyltransferase family 4 protein [Deltaproteobacteria bacterium]